MSGQFKVGEVLVGQNFSYNIEKNGMECEVIEGLKVITTQQKWDGKTVTEPLYIVQWRNGDVTSQRPFTLRRKQPPSGEQSVLDMFKLPAPSKEIA